MTCVHFFSLHEEAPTYKQYSLSMILRQIAADKSNGTEI